MESKLFYFLYKEKKNLVHKQMDEKIRHGVQIIIKVKEI